MDFEILRVQCDRWRPDVNFDINITPNGQIFTNFWLKKHGKNHYFRHKNVYKYWCSIIKLLIFLSMLIQILLNFEILRVQCDRSRWDVNFDIKFTANGQNFTNFWLKKHRKKWFENVCRTLIIDHKKLLLFLDVLI